MKGSIVNVLETGGKGDALYLRTTKSLLSYIPHLGRQGEVVAVVLITQKSLILNLRNALRQGDLGPALLESVSSYGLHLVVALIFRHDNLTPIKLGTNFIDNVFVLVSCDAVGFFFYGSNACPLYFRTHNLKTDLDRVVAAVRVNTGGVAPDVSLGICLGAGEHHKQRCQHGDQGKFFHR